MQILCHFIEGTCASKDFSMGEGVAGGVLDPIPHAYEEQFCTIGRITKVLYKELSR